MRSASALRWPWLVIGAVPPEESIRISDQITPVEICTEATFPRAMLSSLLPNRRDLARLTCCGVTMRRTGKNKLPLVQRLAVKVSELGRVTIVVLQYPGGRTILRSCAPPGR